LPWPIEVHRRKNMRKILIIGIAVLFAGMALVQGALSMEKEISSNEFSVGTPESYVNVTETDLVISDHDGDLYNNDAKIFVYNNATYNGITFDVTAGESNGWYPSKVALDLGNNGRDEYRFDGWSVGQWGNQSNIINRYWESGKSHDYSPTPEGQLMYVKLPSRATVNSVDLNISHPLIPVLFEGYFDRDNSEVGNSYYYYYKYDYSTGSSSSYVYMYYHGTDYKMHYSTMNYAYPSYKYTISGNTYCRGNPDARIFLKWDLDDRDFAVPPGATILKYELNYPVRNYHGYAGSYGYDWTSNNARYYAGEKDFGAFAVTSDLPTDDDMNYYYSYYDAWYYYIYRNPYSQSAVDEYYYDFIPTNRTTPEDSVTLPEHFGSTTYQDIYDVTYNLTGVAQEWMDGTLENNGVMVAMYSTPYGDMPYDDPDDFVYYNSAGSPSGARSRNNYQFYYGGFMYNPLYTANSAYYQYYPKVLISYDLASKGPWVDVADDGNVEYQHVGDLVGSQAIGGTQAYANAINTYLRTHLPDEVDDYGNEFTYVPIRLGADSAGKVVVDNLRIKYDYTARVNYNPISGTLLDELNAVVPADESGWSMIEVNITSNTEGRIILKDLELTGTKPNYRPTVVDEIVVPPVEEGIVDPQWLELTQFFHDEDQDVSTLDYRVQENSASDHVDLFITRPETRGGLVYLGIDTSKDENWFGDVEVVISATDDGGKDIWTDPFTISILPVNDEPYPDPAVELPEITGEEGIDSILIEYNAPTGRGVAMGKVSMLMSDDGKPFFSDVEGERIYLGFQLLDSEMNEALLDTSNDEGFKIYRGHSGEVSLYVLPPEYTEDPDNFILVIGSNPDYNCENGIYYLRVFTSDDPQDIYGQTNQTIPIMIMPVNDPPKIASIPDVVMDEDSSYTGDIDFIAEYLSDIDSDMSDLTVTFTPSAEEIQVSLEEGTNHLMVQIDMDFNGVVPVTVEASDGIDSVFSAFNVRIRSINDPPKVVVSNLFNGKIIDDMFYIRGTANDIEKELRWVEVGVVEKDGFLYEDDWGLADGAYVWQYLMDIRDLKTGEYDVYVRAYDGRDYSDTLKFVVKVQTPEPEKPSPPPVVTILSDLSGDQSDKIEVGGTAIDESGYVAFVEYRVDGGIWRRASLEGEEWTAVINTRQLSNDEHNLSVRAYDGKTYSGISFKRFTVFNADSDLDGIDNEMELKLLLDPFNPLDGTMDFDEDGFSNAEEIRANTDIFDGASHPDTGEKSQILDTWAWIFLAAAIIAAIIIISLFILNIRIERNMHKWREELYRRKMERRPKTLLQKVVEMAPMFGSAAMAPAGPALPGTGVEVPDKEALPPAEESQNQ